VTNQELEIMKVVWRRQRATVREVYEELQQNRTLAYTTVMTVMRVMESKGYLRKWREGRADVYEPVLNEEKVKGSMVKDFLDRLFDGSAEPLLLHLVEQSRVSPEELEKARALLKRKGK